MKVGMLSVFQVHGTPEQVIEKLSWIHQIAGPMNLNVSFSFGGMPFDQSEASMRLVVEKVLPTVQSWSCDPKLEASA